MRGGEVLDGVAAVLLGAGASAEAVRAARTGKGKLMSEEQNGLEGGSPSPQRLCCAIFLKGTEQWVS